MTKQFLKESVVISVICSGMIKWAFDTGTHIINGGSMDPWELVGASFITLITAIWVS